ncbi:MAG: DUF1963 domain-containing protein [Aliishimia sp.]
MGHYKAAILTPNKSLQVATLSFIGGIPTKGENPWPSHPQRPDTPLTLLAQLSCEDLVRAVPSSPLPDSGVLQFFFDTDQFIDSDDTPACRVVWQSNPDLNETLTTSTPLNNNGGGLWSSLFGKKKPEIDPPRALPQTNLDFQAIETTQEGALEDVANHLGIDLSDYTPDHIGPWNFWHQALGELPPDLGGGPLSREPTVAHHILLLRLVCDEEHGLNWDGEHNPSLTFWISKTDLSANRWDRAYALFSDF